MVLAQCRRRRGADRPAPGGAPQGGSRLLGVFSPRPRGNPRPPRSSTPCAEVAAASGFTLAKGQVLPDQPHLNRLLAQAEGTEFDELINMTTLRSMQQAYLLPRRTSAISAWR